MGDDGRGGTRGTAQDATLGTRRAPEHGSGARAHWPQLPDVADWQPTLDTVHLWSQVLGKIQLASTPMVNQWWNVPLTITSRGMSTALLHVAGRGVELALDLVDQELVITASDGGRRSLPLRPGSVASFYESTLAALRELGLPVTIWPHPVEIPGTTRLDQDVEHGAYDGAAMRQFWLGLLQAQRVLGVFRGRFDGKASPVQFFWGSFDLAVSRFSGRPAPRYEGSVPNCPPRVMQEGYREEVSACGFWPGGSDEGSFYAYAYPESDGFPAADVPPGAAYDASLGEFLLPYRTVREAVDPDALLLDFLQCTYAAAADLGHWDRASLEAPWARGIRP